MEAGDYDDGSIMYVEEEDHNKKLVAQLKDYLDNTPKEQLERDLFEIECECEGIDPNDENAIVCIIFAYTLLTALIEHDKDWFFLRKRN